MTRKTPGAPRRHTEAAPDDPWSAVTRGTLDALRGDGDAVDDPGDTAQLLRSGGGEQLEVGQGVSSDILELLDQSIAGSPARADLWMMRFETQKTLGLKAPFAAALADAWRAPMLRGEIDWPALRAMWQELAPGEPPPGEVRFPEPKRAAAPAARGARRRFSDVALHIAGDQLTALAQAYAALRAQPAFFQEFARNVAGKLGRPSRLVLAPALSRAAGDKVRIFLKREDLRQTTPEVEMATAQAYLATALGKRLLVTGNDVDGHSLALAAVAPAFGLQCLIVLRAEEMERKPALVAQLKRDGARAESMARFKLDTDDPREAALRLWRQATDRCHLALSFGTGPLPYPTMVGDFQSLLGRETELQLRAQGQPERPRSYVAAVHSEADSIGFILPQLARPEVELVYADADRGAGAEWQPSQRLAEYNGAIREHAWLRASGRITHVTIADGQAREAQRQLAALESVNVGLEDARAVALATMLARRNTGPWDLVVLVA